MGRVDVGEVQVAYMRMRETLWSVAMVWVGEEGREKSATTFCVADVSAEQAQFVAKRSGFKPWPLT